MMRYMIRLLMIMLLLQGSVFAKEKQYLLQESTYKVVNAAQELMTADKYSQAQTQLLAVLEKTKAGSYDRAVVQQTLGYAYSAREQYKKAREQFQQALDSQALPEPVSHNLRYNLGQLLLAEERYKEGVQVLEQWFRDEPKPPNSARVLIATAYYQLDRYAKSVQQMEQAVRNETKPPENWYQLLLAGYIELKRYGPAAKVLEKLIVRYPEKEQYWSQLSGVYAQQNKTVSALSVQALANHLSLKDGRIVERLADMYRYIRVPYKSAVLLEKGMEQGAIKRNYKNLNRLADSWLAAKEKAKAAAVLKQTLAMDKSGEAELKYGRVLFELEQWQSASAAFKRSLKQLKGKQRGRAALMAGLAQFHRGELEAAQALLEQASSYQRERAQAVYWISYIEQILVHQQQAEDEATVS